MGHCKGTKRTMALDLQKLCRCQMCFDDLFEKARPAEKKRLIGERLYPKIQVVEPRLAGKITGMLLEMDNDALLVLLAEQRALMNKINEALAVLKDHQQKQSQQNPGSTKNPSSQ